MLERQTDIENITNAINQGLAYLKLQLDTKEFPFSSDCFGKKRHDLQSASNVPEYPYADLNEKFSSYALLLLLEQHLPSSFRSKLISIIRPKKIEAMNFFGDLSSDYGRFPNDQDTTSVCYHALLSTNTFNVSELSSLSKSIYENVNEDGLLHVYRVPKEDKRYNRIDAVAIVNMVRLAYAQRHESLVQRSEDYVFDWLNSGDYKNGTPYYPSAYTFLFLCSLLASTNYRTKIRFMDTLRREYSQIKQGDLKYPLDYAHTILTGAKMGFHNESLVDKLLGMQNEDGSWPADAWYSTNSKIYLGSMSFSTVMSVLALIETIQLR